MTDKPKCKRLRLRNYDYGSAGAYRVTICTKRQVARLRSVVGRAALCAPQVELTPLRQVVREFIEAIGETYPCVYVDNYAIMPNHVHLLLRMDEFGAQGAARPTVSQVVRALKVMLLTCGNISTTIC